MKTLALMVVCAAAAWCYPKLPIAFEPNQGQSPAGVDYVVRAGGHTLLLRATRTEMVTPGAKVTAVLERARKTARPEASQLLAGTVSYLRGNDRTHWVFNVPTYAAVRYHDVYPGIDVSYYSGSDGLEYDYIVAAGSDPARIRIRFNGIQGMRVDVAGDLVLNTASGEIRYHKPSIYQEIGGVRHAVAGGYEIRGTRARFWIGHYDHTRALVIDPTLTWATYFGSSSQEDVYGTALDATSHTYLTGSTVSSVGDLDFFITRLNPDGTAAAGSTVIAGGSLDDQAQALAVDASGNVYVTGYTDSDDFPTANVSQTVNTAGFGYDGFILVIDPTFKSLLYSTFLGGSDTDVAYGIVLDSANDAYLVGATLSTDFPTTRGVTQVANAGGADAFVAEFDATGQLLFSTYLGGGTDDVGYGIAIDSGGNIYVTGYTKSTNFPLKGAPLQSQNAGGATGEDAFVAKFIPRGLLTYATYLGGNGDDSGQGIAVDATGGVYVTGQTASTNFPLAQAYQSTLSGTSDAFVARLTPAGDALTFSTFLGGSGDDIGNTIVIDGANNSYIAGATTSTDFPTSNAFQTVSGGAADAIVASFSSTGALAFSSYLGGNGSDTARSAALNCATGLVVVGNTASTNFPATAGVAQTKYAGNTDGFVAKIGAGGGATSISAGGVVNGATFANAPVAPGSLISIFGSNLASAPALANTTPWTGTLGGTSVTINGAPAPMYYASPGQANVQVPYETATGDASLTVSGCGGASAPATFTVAQAAPYLFQSADGSVIAQNQDFSINGPNNPAEAGSVVTIYLTGIGPVDNPVPTGSAAPLSPLSNATLPKSATIGGWDSTIFFLGLTPQFVGLAQANLVVPSLSPGTYPVVITIGGVASNGANLYVQ
ncbi:MAG TPA: SBBP repeat-containing protein [Bryobacteraceae bacterium]|nr:SBBP repeat-containing protein [Bryobacteraceae bacterium]